MVESKPKRPHWYITHHPHITLQTDITFIWLQITSTNPIYMVTNNVLSDLVLWLETYVNELMVRNLRQRILRWKLTETAPFINQYYEYYGYLYHTKIPFIWLGITSTNITLKIKPKRSHLYHTKIPFIWLGITSTNITLKIKPKRSHLYHTKITFVWLGTTSANITLQTTAPFINQYYVEYKHHIYMVRNNGNKYYVENKTKRTHL